MPNYIYDGTALPTKTDRSPIPVGEDVNKWFESADFMKLRSFLNDARTAVINGKVSGFDEQGSRPTGISGIGDAFIWLGASGLQWYDGAADRHVGRAILDASEVEFDAPAIKFDTGFAISSDPDKVIVTFDPGSITVDAGAAWLDGTTNPSQSMQARFDAWIAALSDQTGATNGAAKIGARAQTSGSSSVSTGSVDSQILEMLALIDAGGGGGSSFYQTVQNVGTPVTQRAVLNLTSELVASDVSSKTQLALAAALSAHSFTGLTSGGADGAVDIATNTVGFGTVYGRNFQRANTSHQISLPAAVTAETDAILLITAGFTDLSLSHTLADFSTRQLKLSQVAQTSHVGPGLEFVEANNTGQTASTESPSVKWTFGTKTWAAGSLAVQRFAYLTSPTAAFASASTLTDAYTLYVIAPTAGSNATLTNKYALGLEVSDASTNTVLPVLQVIRRTTGTAGQLGASINYQLEADDGNSYTSAKLISYWTDQTGGAATSAFKLNLSLGGVDFQRMRLDFDDGLVVVSDSDNDFVGGLWLDGRWSPAGNSGGNGPKIRLGTTYRASGVNHDVSWTQETSVDGNGDGLWDLRYGLDPSTTSVLSLRAGSNGAGVTYMATLASPFSGAAKYIMRFDKAGSAQASNKFLTVTRGSATTILDLEADASDNARLLPGSTKTLIIENTTSGTAVAAINKAQGSAGDYVLLDLQRNGTSKGTLRTNASDYLTIQGTSSPGVSIPVLVLNKDQANALDNKSLSLQVQGTERAYFAFTNQNGFQVKGSGLFEAVQILPNAAAGGRGFYVGSDLGGLLEYAVNGPRFEWQFYYVGVTGGTQTGLPVSELTEFDVNLSSTKTFGSGGGTIATQRAMRVRPPTYAAGAAITMTKAAALCIDGPPVAGSNVTITEGFGLWVKDIPNTAGFGGALFETAISAPTGLFMRTTGAPSTTTSYGSPTIILGATGKVTTDRLQRWMLIARGFSTNSPDSNSFTDGKLVLLSSNDGSTYNDRVLFTEFGPQFMGTKIGFFGGALTDQQTVEDTLTNNVTSGGTNNTIANFTDLTTYANDAATIRNDIYQLARKLRILEGAIKAYGFVAT